MSNVSLLNPFVLDYMNDVCWASSQHALHMAELRENKCLKFLFLSK